MPNMRTHALCGAAFIALTAFASTASAQAADNGTDVAELVITSNSLEQTLPQELARYGNDISIVTDETIKNELYPDVAQALRMQVPGLYVAPRAGPFSYVDVSLQGSRFADVLWLVDGVRVNNRLYADTTPTDTLPASMIERIEVLKGGQALFYGTQASAGVINVVTKSFSDEFGGQVSVTGDTNESLHADGFVRGAIGKHKLVAFASRDQSDGYEIFTAYQPSATQRDRGYAVTSGGVKYGYAFSDALGLNLRYQHTDAHIDYPGAALTNNAYNTRDEEILSGNLDWTPNDKAQFFLKAYYHDWDSTFTTVNNVIGSPGVTVTPEDHLFWGYNDQGVSLMTKLNLNKGFEYDLAYDFQKYSGRDESLTIGEQEEQVHAYVAQLRTTKDLFETVRFAVGVRHNVGQEESATVWNASGRWDPSEAFYLEGAAGTAFNLPTAEQLFAVDPCCAAGNPNLEAERSLNFNVSIGGRLQAGRPIAWQLTGFDRTIDKLIIDDYSDPAFPDGIYINEPGKVKIRGGEFIVRAALSDSISADLSYTHTQARLEGTNVQLNRLPEDYAKASLVYSPMDRNYGGSISGLWTGDVFHTPSGFARTNYGDYFVADLAAYVFLDGDKRQNRLGLRVENLLDEEYSTRINSANTDTGVPAKFLYGQRGVPRTLHVNYTKTF